MERPKDVPTNNDDDCGYLEQELDELDKEIWNEMSYNRRSGVELTDMDMYVLISVSDFKVVFTEDYDIVSECKLNGFSIEEVY